jgi:hypothetical protein
MKNKPVGVSFAPHILAEAEAVALSLGMTRSRTIAMAVVLGLPLLRAGHGLDPSRLLGHLEYIQAAMALWMEREHPDIHQQLADITVARMDEFHGQA